MAQIRGLFNFNGVLHGVRDDTLFSVDSSGFGSTLATIGSAGGPVDMAQNLTQLVIGDGAQKYVWDGASLYTDATYVLGDSLTFIDQRIVFPLRNSQQFQWTSLGDATVIDPLAFASAEGSPDQIVSVLANLRELLILGESTGEVWHSVGGTTVFERSQSEYLQVGCAAARSAVVVNDTPLWLGQNDNGMAQVFGGRGQRVSTRAIEERFEGLDLSQARAFSYVDGPSYFYCLNVPTVETTLVFDVTFKEWHERAEWNGNYSQWRPTCHAFAYGRHFFGSDDGNIYRLNADLHTNNGDTLIRDRISPVVATPDFKRHRFSSFELICDRATTAQIQLRYSDDNGFTWSNWHYDSAGAIGEYKDRIKFNRLGSARDRVFQVRTTDDASFNPVTVNLEMV